MTHIVKCTHDRLFTVLSDAAAQCDRAAPVQHKFGGLTIAAEGWDGPGERWFDAFCETVLLQLFEETKENGA